ncbi:hypothetical protein B9Z51_17780 [Limnohabitans sp. T6-5]|nr:hypothetical protein B9Z51_17780 [Limnohabitans sp. T6-5]
MIGAIVCAVVMHHAHVGLFECRPTSEVPTFRAMVFCRSVVEDPDIGLASVDRQQGWLLRGEDARYS